MAEFLFLRQPRFGKAQHLVLSCRRPQRAAKRCFCRPVVQPRVRHRFQSDRVGLTVSSQKLVSDGGTLAFELEDSLGRAVQLTLGAVYAAASLPAAARSTVFDALQSALVWARPVDNRFISWLMDGAGASLADLRSWNGLSGKKYLQPGQRLKVRVDITRQSVASRG